MSHPERNDRAAERIARGLDPDIAITSTEQLEALAQAALSRHTRFQTHVAAIMTSQRAAFVRYLRVERCYSWRDVAETCFAEWEPELPAAVRETWVPRCNQLMGLALCELVARLDGQHHMRPPWN